MLLSSLGILAAAANRIDPLTSQFSAIKIAFCLRSFEPFINFGLSFTLSSGIYNVGGFLVMLTTWIALLVTP